MKRVSICESNIQSLNGQIEQAQVFIATQSGSQEVTSDNIDELVFAKTPLSQKMLDLVAKENALEDGLAVIKKCYEKDQIDLKEFLSQVRKMSGKQFKTTIKKQKLMQAMGV